MPAKLASHLVLSRHGIYYLRTKIDGREKRISLRTRCPDAAKLAAYQFGATRMGGKFNLKIKLPSGVEIETNETPEENAVALEMVKALAASKSTRPGDQFNTDRHSEIKPISVHHATRYYMLDRADQITAGTKRTWQTSFNKLVAALGERTVHEISTQDISTALQNIAVLSAPKTVKKDAQTWAMLWRWLIDRKHARDQVVKIPTWGRAQLVRLNQERGRDRLSYDQSDLNKIFDAGRLNSLTRPEEVFLPLLGLYTGARLEALCRLKCSDFTTSTLRFDAGHDKTGKERTVPLHPHLINSGILDYVEDVRKAYGSDSMIFPHLNEVRGRFGHYFSRQYGEQRKVIGIEEGKDFHSFRVHLISHLQAAGCPADLRRFFVGHETGERLDVHERNYSKATFTPERLAELVFPYLTFTRPDWRYTAGTAIAEIERLMRGRELARKRKARK
jgi:integrase